MTTFSVRLKGQVDPDFAWKYFESLGCRVLFATEEEGHHDLIIQTEFPIPDDLVHSYDIYELPEMDYAIEWERHAPSFKEGKAQVNLKNGQVLELLPGAGFGDLSHPTTQLVLDLMQDYVKDQMVVDIGSGSGILALAAGRLNAKKVFGIDIDPKAVLHANDNARLNKLDKKVHFSLPDALGKVESPVVILMNMIIIEQMDAWYAFTKNRSLSGIMMTSGVLEEQEEDYLLLSKNKGWFLKDKKKLGNWLGFVFYF